MKTVIKDIFHLLDKKIYTTLYSGWIYISLIFGTIITWIIKGDLPVSLIGGKEFASRSLFTQTGIGLVLLFFLTALIFFSIKVLGLIFPKPYIFLSKKMDSDFHEREPRNLSIIFGQVDKLRMLFISSHLLLCVFRMAFLCYKTLFYEQNANSREN